MRTAVTIGSISLFILTHFAQAQGSFSEFAESSVDYSVTDVKARLACDDLQRFTDMNITIVSTEAYAEDGDAPAFCRVSGVITPEIEFRVNLPEVWNRRFYMTGNGGHAGEDLDIPYAITRHHEALRLGFVTAATNTGHSAAKEPDATFAYNNDQKLIDYAFRAVHLTAVTAKRMARLFYDRPVAYSYWDGCSTGGRQGLMEAQRFPADFDGILAGAPVLDFTGTTIMGLWYADVLSKTPIGLDKMAIISDVLFKKCDGIDGLEDGLIDDPRRCEFDPTRDLPICSSSEDGSGCVTSAQAEALKKIYTGPTTSAGENYFPGMPLGSEKAVPGYGGQPASGWAGTILGVGGRDAFAIAISKSTMKYMVFPQDQPDWDWTTFDFDDDPAQLDALGRLVDATNPNLSEFENRGGKLLMYFGWADPLLMPQMGIDYYEEAVRTNGQQTADFFRLFMMPGVFHCSGGYGPDRFDGMTTLIEWVENGTAPELIKAQKVENGQVTRSRPLCPYPRVARYDGSGDISDAASFTCRMPNN